MTEKSPQASPEDHRALCEAHDTLGPEFELLGKTIEAWGKAEKVRAKVSPPIEQAYLRAKDAAVYLGVSVPVIRRWAGRYDIPKCGPKANMFRRSDLDVFMDNPYVFLADRLVRPKRRRGSFTPVSWE